MSWNCILIPTPAREDFFSAEKMNAIPIGAMFFDESDLPKRKPWQFGANSIENLKRRKPLYVKLPGGMHFMIDGRAYDFGLVKHKPDGAWDEWEGYHGDGWIVTGEAPLLTLAPSINYPGRYHGWLQNGVISDDCEGRKFS